MSQFLNAGKEVWDLCTLAISANMGVVWKLEEVVRNESFSLKRLLKLFFFNCPHEWTIPETQVHLAGENKKQTAHF